MEEELNEDEDEEDEDDDDDEAEEQEQEEEQFSQERKRRKGTSTTPSVVINQILDSLFCPDTEGNTHFALDHLLTRM